MAHGRPAKRRRITSPSDENTVPQTIAAKDLFNRAADWDLETAYERRPRKKEQRQFTRLPIKTAEGKVQRIKEPVSLEYEVEDSESSSTTGEAGERHSETPPTEEIEDGPAIPLRQQIVAAKEELARLAGLINEDPEEHAGSFKKLVEFTDSAPHSTIRNLGLATQAAVYVDVIPGYRIRAYKDEDLGSKVSKDVRKLRQYEQALVSEYQSYVKQLTRAAKRSKQSPTTVSGAPSVPISCVCKLLTSVPHFNFRTDLLQIVVETLSSRQISADFERCVEALSEFFDGDDDGAPSFEAVSILTKMMKAKDYRIHQRVLDTFFHLRLLSELSLKNLDKTPDGADQMTYRGKKVKPKWEHRSKRERKLARERKAVEKDMKEASATVDHAEREKIQSETLKAVFSTYLRILKLRIPDLTGAVLEGLAKFAHLINQDLFGDLLEVLKDIVNRYEVEDESTESDFRTPLLATQTAFTLLSSQEIAKSASSLHLDLSFFTTYAYRTLYPITLSPSLEPRTNIPSPHSPNPSSTSSTNKINLTTPTLLLTRILSSILLPTHGTPPPATTIAALTKRVLTTTLETPEKSTLALLSLLIRITDKHGRKISPLWYSEERKGNGVFDGMSEIIEGTNVWSLGSGVWEGELLTKHYCPGVREKWGEVEGLVRSIEEP